MLACDTRSVGEVLKITQFLREALEQAMRFISGHAELKPMHPPPSRPISSQIQEGFRLLQHFTNSPPFDVHMLIESEDSTLSEMTQSVTSLQMSLSQLSNDIEGKREESARLSKKLQTLKQLKPKPTPETLQLEQQLATLFTQYSRVFRNLACAEYEFHRQRSKDKVRIVHPDPSPQIRPNSSLRPVSRKSTN